MSRSKRHRSPAAAVAAKSTNVGCPSPGPEGVAVEQPSSPAPAQPTHEQVAERAHQIWESRGCPMGQDFEIWLAAEGELNGLLG